MKPPDSHSLTHTKSVRLHGVAYVKPGRVNFHMVLWATHMIKVELYTRKEGFRIRSISHAFFLALVCPPSGYLVYRRSNNSMSNRQRRSAHRAPRCASRGWRCDVHRTRRRPGQGEITLRPGASGWQRWERGSESSPDTRHCRLKGARPDEMHN